MRSKRSYKLPSLLHKQQVHFKWNKRPRYYYRKWPFALLAVCILVVTLLSLHTHGTGPKHPTVGHNTDNLAKTLKLKSWLPFQQLTRYPSSSSSGGSTATGTPSMAHANITTTIFWVGEPSDASNGYIPNAASAWDESWESHFGGLDDASHRNGFQPAAFTPKENAFYFALPYSDFTDSGARKASAGNCPNSGNSSLAAYSWCKNAWIAIKHGNKTVYAQWEDVGPFEEDDVSYVFGSQAPRNTQGSKAGLDVSPAVRDYLSLQDVDKCDWVFVSAQNVPQGPWTQKITTSKGESN